MRGGDIPDKLHVRRGYNAADGFCDALGLAGTGLVAFGAWMAWPPAGLIAPGVILLALSVVRYFR